MPTLKTLGQFKKSLKSAGKLYVWSNWQVDDGDYIEVSKASFLRSIGADEPNDGAHGGKMDTTPIAFRVEEDGIYVN